MNLHDSPPNKKLQQDGMLFSMLPLWHEYRQKFFLAESAERSNDVAWNFLLVGREEWKNLCIVVPLKGNEDKYFRHAIGMCEGLTATLMIRLSHGQTPIMMMRFSHGRTDNKAQQRTL
jgi:hypothetical protein